MENKRSHLFIDRTGEKHITNEGYEVEIITYNNNRSCIIKFEDKHTQEHSYDAIIKGNIRNVFHKSVFGVGYIGHGEHQPREGSKMSKKHTLWANILRRCYNKDALEKSPCYIGCTVIEEWHNFQNFAEWMENNYNPETMQGWHLDKDILFKGNKVYSPETCAFVPREINVLFTSNRAKRGDLPVGVYRIGNRYSVSMGGGDKRNYFGLFNIPEEAFQAYKTAKEVRIKEVADKWKGLISKQVYEAMYNYIVEITD